MILIQQLQVLPAASCFKVLDNNKPVLEGSVSSIDKTLMFKDANEDLKFQRVYSSYHVTLIDKEEGIWIINVR